jgi:serine-type D-Ala-D-Ala carboxypeptidase (penicillin-binding protein 5/6)
VLDRYGNDLDAVVTVPAEATAVNGSRMNLSTGEKITVRSLLHGALIESANDAAQTLAYFVGGTPDRFVLLMNQRAAALNLRDTHFANAIGFDADDHYSTAKDLAQLTRVAMNDSTFAKIVATSKITVSDVSGNIQHPLVTTNKLLGTYTNVTGVKTGTTSEAGESLVASVIGSGGQRIVVVLLDSPDRFSEGRRTLDWALKSYTWIEPL